MPSTIDNIRDSLDPTVVSNALYETMLDWHDANKEITDPELPTTGQRYRRLRSERVLLERLIGRFINRPPESVREMLCEHYGVRS